MQRDGVLPLYEVNFYNDNDVPCQLEDSAISGGNASSHSGNCRIVYYVEYQARIDFYDLRDKIANFYVKGVKTPYITRILNNRFPGMMPLQYYPVEFHYRLPGTNAISSVTTQQIHYKRH